MLTSNKNSSDKIRKTKIVTIIGLVLNLLLAGVKIAVSIIAGSVSLLADGLDSALDIATTIIGFYAVMISEKPADEDHQFGHYKYENFFTLGIAFILVASSGIIAYQSITRLVEKTVLDFSILNVIVACSSIVLKTILVFINVNIGKKIDAPILVANGLNFRTDIFTSTVVLIGVTVGSLSINGFSLYWLDPSIALIISLVIIWTAKNIIKDSAGVLLDESADPQFCEKIIMIAKNQEGVLAVRNIRSRFVGSNLYLCDIDILVDPNLTIQEGHIIAENVEAAIKLDMPVKYCQIHMEPYSAIKSTTNDEKTMDPLT